MPKFDVEKYNVPPLIKDMILKLRDDRSPLHIRNNYKMMLDNVMRACQIEIEEFGKEPTCQPKPKKKPAAKRY